MKNFIKKLPGILYQIGTPVLKPIIKYPEITVPLILLLTLFCFGIPAFIFVTVVDIIIFAAIVFACS